MAREDFERLPSEAQAPLKQKYAHHYAERIKQYGTQKPQPVAQFEMELAHIRRGQEYAVSLDPPSNNDIVTYATDSFWYFALIRDFETLEYWYDQAIKAAERLNVNATRAQVHCYRGIVAERRQRWEEAEHHYRRALEDFRPDATDVTLASACYGLGNVAFERGKLDVAQDYYERIYLHSEFPGAASVTRANACLGRGNVATDLGDNEPDVKKRLAHYTQADAFYQRVLDKDLYPDARPQTRAIACYSRGNVALLLGHNEPDVKKRLAHYTQADAFYQRVLDNSEFPGATPQTRADACYGLGFVAYENKDYPVAIKHYTKSIELNSTSHAAYGNRALAFEMLKQYEDALEDAKRALEIEPNFDSAFRTIERVRQKLAEQATPSAAPGGEAAS